MVTERKDPLAARITSRACAYAQQMIAGHQQALSKKRAEQTPELAQSCHCFQRMSDRARVTAISSADVIARPVRPPTLTAATLASTDHELTVIIPAYNERRRLPKTLAALAEFLNASRIDYRVMVADDGSRDGTAKLTNGLGPRFSTLRLEQNAGKGCAVRTAMLAATGQVVAFTDADLPYDLTALRQAYEWIRQGQCEVALGTRNARKSAGLDQRRWIRKVATPHSARS